MSLSAANRASTESGSGTGPDALALGALPVLPALFEETRSEGLLRWNDGLELCAALF